MIATDGGPVRRAPPRARRVAASAKPVRRARTMPTPPAPRVAPQARAYVSQGKAVEHVANRQRQQAAARPAPRARPVRATPPADIKSNADRKRAADYRTSRPYYRTYRSVWHQTPKVQRTEAALKATYVPGAKSSPERLHNLRVYDRELRQGPDVLSSEAYQKYAKGLWGRAGKYYPRPHDMPKTVVDYDPAQRKHALAWVKNLNPEVVHVSPEITRMFMGPKEPGLRGPSETVPLHEWAHTRQPLGLKVSDQALTEGGAEAVDRLISKRLKLPYTPSPSARYRRWARLARKRGKGYLLKGQYQPSVKAKL